MVQSVIDRPNWLCHYLGNEGGLTVNPLALVSPDASQAAMPAQFLVDTVDPDRAAAKRARGDMLRKSAIGTTAASFFANKLAGRMLG